MIREICDFRFRTKLHMFIWEVLNDEYSDLDLHEIKNFIRLTIDDDSLYTSDLNDSEIQFFEQFRFIVIRKNPFDCWFFETGNAAMMFTTKQLKIG